MNNNDSYDAIVIGSGLGGLTAGAVYARAGKRVLVLERNEKFGGAATVFKRDRLSIEVALHEIDGLDPGDPKMRVLKRLGLLDNIRMLPIDHLYEVRHPMLGERFVMPDGVAPAIEYLTQRFPRHRAAIERYFRILGQIRTKAAALIDHMDSRWWWLLNGPIFPLRFWPLLRYERTTVGALLQDLFGDDEAIKLALCGNILYYTNDPDRFALLYHGVAQGSFHIGGGHYVQGGSQAISDRLVEIIREAGGEAMNRRVVTKILLHDGRAVGVEHERFQFPGRPAEGQPDRRTHRTPVLFGNAAPQVLADMLPDTHRENFLTRYRNIPMSTALWNVYLGLDRKASEFGVTAYSTFVYPDWFKGISDMRRSAGLLREMPGDKLPMFEFVDYSYVNPTPPDGEYFPATICGFDDMRNWDGLDSPAYQARKNAWMERMIAALDGTYPGIAGSIVHKEMATARALQGYLNTPGGAVYGFAQEPMHAGRHRPSCKTRVRGLWLASAFARPGGGFTAAMLAGEAAADAAIRQG